MYKMYINGQCMAGESDAIQVINPATEGVVERFGGATPAQTTLALESAEEAFSTWSVLSINERGEWINKLRDALLDEKKVIMDILIKETGKTVSDAEYDFNMLADCLLYFQDEAKRLSGEVITDYDNQFRNIITRVPVGVVVAHLAWNFPLLNVGYKLGPVLASGCTCVLKPSKETPLATLHIGKVAEKIGFPKGVINIVCGSTKEVAEVMNASTIPSLITLIGSTQTGLKIVEQSATSVKHYSLELGGNAPAIVMPSADVKDAAEKLVGLKFTNAGQVCVSPNRVFVHEDVYEEFIGHALTSVKQVKLGWGDDEGATMGPLLTQGARERMTQLVEDAKAKGAKVLYGGKAPEGKEVGYYYIPTLLEDVDKSMKVYTEEVFGPIMPILSFSNQDDVIAMANDTEYGLASYVFSQNLGDVMEISDKLQYGTVCVNEPFYAVNLPHGGLKQSGVGKDCSRYSLEEYYNVKRVSIKR